MAFRGFPVNHARWFCRKHTSWPRRHSELGAAEVAAPAKPVTGALRKGAGARAWISRRRPGGVPRPALYRALQRAGRGDIHGPDLRKRDTVLAAVKDASRRRRRWPSAILDCGCARCHSAYAGRDEETALRSSKETDVKQAGERCFSRRL